MIVFDLRCAGGHVFEAWFASGAAYEEQRDTGRLCCPICGNAGIGKAVMAPAVASGSDRTPALSPAAVKAALTRIADAQARALSSSEWVGSGFARRARAMHNGTEPRATIHGQATLAEARALVDDGVPVAPLPLPVRPPGEVH